MRGVYDQKRLGRLTDFLLELRSEEIPARMQRQARADLARMFTELVAKAGLNIGAVETFSTPRRLVLIARDVPLATAAVREERKGPKATAPEQALAGFLRSTGLTREVLTERDGVLFAVVERAGRDTAAVLAEAIPTLVRTFPWPKSMRWGAASTSTESLRWVRPFQGIVALLGEAIVPIAVDGFVASATTEGHRFHHSGPITIGSAADHGVKLRAGHVIVDHDAREAMVRDGARAAARTAGLTLVEDEGLVVENAGLTEWPVPLLGRFDAAYLGVPPEVIRLTMRTNQKYFACLDRDGALANAFVCTANIAPSDGGAAVVAGNERVLSARLADAKFFWENDLKVPLDEQAGKLKHIVFHEKLGTVADKVERVAKLARWLVESGVIKPSPLCGEGGERSEPGAERPSSRHSAPDDASASSPSPPSGEGLATLAERAARLCKADLVTGMVGEFPELQGIIGGHLARAQGEDPQVADAIRDHYKPVGQGDDVPTAPVTVAVSLADKLDTIAAFFGASMPPTGSKDPFALRRSTLGVLQLVFQNGLRIELSKTLTMASRWLLQLSYDSGNVQLVSAFLADRLKVQQREAGVRHDLIDAVFALGDEDDLVRLLDRVHALQVFVGTEDGAKLLGGYKRAANILKKEGRDPTLPRHPRERGDPASTVGDQEKKLDPRVREGDGAFGLREGDDVHSPPLSYTPGPCEVALIAALDAAEPAADAAIAAEDFAGAMVALASLRAPIDAFFDTVMVNDPDAAKRAARLALLARVTQAVHRVADFSKIEG